MDREYYSKDVKILGLSDGAFYWIGSFIFFVLVQASSFFIQAFFQIQYCSLKGIFSKVRISLGHC
jgi:hypothetical protein